MTPTALLFALAWGQSEPTLVAGDTLLEPCLDDPACGSAVLRLLGENMTEYGFVQQADPIAVSALGGKGMGFVAEVRLDTVTFGPKNALERSVFIPPALPRISLGYQVGSYTYDDPYPQLAVGVTILPPFRVLQGTVLGGQLDLSAAVPLGTPVVWAGAELAYGYSQVAVPLLGTEEQLGQIAELRPYLPDEGATCAAIGAGCLDRFQQHLGAARAGLSLEPIPAFFAYTRLAAVLIRQRLEVAYDGTRWALGGVQPQLQLGLGARAGDQYQLALGTVLATRAEALSTDGTRLIAKGVFSMSFRFGDPRYWKYREG